jgi:DNA-binding SARP family transcriptional activator/tetratricopeptide (TPR) repeat protein
MHGRGTVSLEVVTGDVMEFQLLGPVEIRVGSQVVDLGSPRQRQVLVALAVDAGRPVPAEVLVDRVWGDAAPSRVRHALHVYVTRIRHMLERIGRDGVPVKLLLRSGGYLLDIDPDRVDVRRFRRLVEQARDQSRPDEQRAALLREALDLWQGTPLAGLTGEWVGRVRDGWQQQRLDAVVAWAQAELRLGRPDSVIGPLAELVDEYPLAESLVAVVMRALYAAGRGAEALDCFAKTRQRLAEHLGADPGAELQGLHQAILRGDPDTGGPPAGRPAAAPPAPSRAVPAQLPLDVHGFVGRDGELVEMDRILAAAGDEPTAVVISAISGTAGVGKTALAVRWAHRVSSGFPDGQLYVNLRGFDPAGSVVSPGEAIRGFLDALDVPAHRIPIDLQAQVSLYRSMLAGKRMLVVLDNAHDAEQVRPLLPGAPGCLAIVTSRDRLTSLVAAEGAYPLALDLLSAEEARQLLTRRLGHDRLAAEPRAVDDIIARCARLPLALTIAAARAATRATLPLAVLAAELRDAGKRLDVLAGGDTVTDVRAVFSWSYRALSETAARLFLLLGLQPGPDIAAPAAASLAGIAPPDAAVALAELAGAHLVAEHVAGRFACHDLLRAYASELVHDREPEPDRRAAQGRLLDHYLHTANTAALLLHPTRDPIQIAPPAVGVLPEQPADLARARSWFAVELPVLVAAIGQAARTGFDPHAWQLAWTLADFFNYAGLWHDQAAAQRTALDAARRIDDRQGQAHCHVNLARAYAQLGRTDDAHTHLRRALDLFAAVGDHSGQTRARLQTAWIYECQGRHVEALGQAEKALDLFRAAGSRSGEASALNSVGWYHALLGDYGQTLTCCTRAVAIFHEVGDRRGEAGALHSLGYAYHHLGDHERATVKYLASLRLARKIGDRYGIAAVLADLGDTYHAAGDPAAARDSWQAALTIFDELDHPGAVQLRDKLHGPVGQMV